MRLLSSQQMIHMARHYPKEDNVIIRGKGHDSRSSLMGTTTLTPDKNKEVGPRPLNRINNVRKVFVIRVFREGIGTEHDDP